MVNAQKQNTLLPIWYIRIRMLLLYAFKPQCSKFGWNPVFCIQRSLLWNLLNLIFPSCPRWLLANKLLSHDFAEPPSCRTRVPFKFVCFLTEVKGSKEGFAEKPEKFNTYPWYIIVVFWMQFIFPLYKFYEYFKINFPVHACFDRLLMFIPFFSQYIYIHVKFLKITCSPVSLCVFFLHATCYILRFVFVNHVQTKRQRLEYE